jgi:hypothetical protein
VPPDATIIQEHHKAFVTTKVKSLESVDILLVCRAHLFLSPQFAKEFLYAAHPTSNP